MTVLCRVLAGGPGVHQAPRGTHFSLRTISSAAK